MTDTIASTTVARPAALWLQTPAHDVAMAFSWLPFAVAAHALAGHPEHMQWLVSATLLFSFAHQPLTLWLAYGDGAQRRAHPTLFAWAPVVAIVAVGVGSSLRPDLVALVAGVWNVGHTIRQRYGLSRLYGRLSGIDCSGDNRLLWSWLSLAVLVALARVDLGGTARAVGLEGQSATAIDVLSSARASTVVLLPIAVAIALVLTAGSIPDEWRRDARSSARLIYLGSTAILLAILAIEPVTGFVAYVGAHAAEYLLVVRWRIGKAAERGLAGDRVGDLARRIGGDGTIVVYAAAVAVLIIAIRAADGSRLAVTVALALGALHLLYDGLIWRSPRPVRGLVAAPAANGLPANVRHQSVAPRNAPC